MARVLLIGNTAQVEGEPTEAQLLDAWRWIQCAVRPERPDYASRKDEVVRMVACAFMAERQLKSALASQQELEERLRREWVAVEDRLPTHGGQVLVCWRFALNTSGPFVSSARYEMGHWDWNSDAANKQRDSLLVSHWQEMPKAMKPDPGYQQSEGEGTPKVESPDSAIANGTNDA